MLLAVLMIAVDPAAHEEPLDELKARLEKAPQEVAAFVERRAGCNHFAGETGSGDPMREREIDVARDALRCDAIDEDDRSLRDKYRGSPQILGLLDQTRDLLGW